MTRKIPFDAPDVDRAALDDVAFTDDVDERLRLIRADRFVGYQQRFVRTSPEQLHRDEQPGRQQPVGVREQRASLDRAGRLVERVRDEVHAAFAREFLFVGEPDADRVREVARARARAVEIQPRVLQVFALVAGEVDVHRVHGDDRRQQRRAFGPAADEVAARHVQSADAPADRRSDLRELDVELRGADRGLGGCERRYGLALLLRARVELLFGNRSRPKQALGALAIVARELQPHFVRA